MLTDAELTHRVLGCVLGGAVGDALGAPFEGLWSRSIPAAHELLTQYAEFEGFPRGQYTDDTQLTVATLQSIVRQNCIDPGDIARSISRLWKTQAVVGPGGACTSAADRLLAGGHWYESGAPIGQAGNGTAMRTAALGLYFIHSTEGLGNVVAQVSRITHQDPRSIAGGVAIASAARLLCATPEIDPESLCNAIAEDMRPFDRAFADLVINLPKEAAGDQESALEYLAWSGGHVREFEDIIITPYVVPTVLAALWSVTEFPSSWDQSVAAVIRLGGDVDTLGAIVGGLMGARLGLAAIPVHLRETVLNARQLHDLALRYVQVILTEVPQS